MGFRTGAAQFDGSINVDGSIYQNGAILSAGGGGSGTVRWASGTVGSNDYVVTAAGDGSIVAEANLKFSGSLLRVTGDVSLSGNYLCASTSYYYLGDTLSNGSWRWYIEVTTGDLIFEKRMSGTWTYKSKIS